MKSKEQNNPGSETNEVDVDALKEGKILFKWSLGGLVALVVALVLFVVWDNDRYHSLKQNDLLRERELVAITEQVKKIQENLPKSTEQLNLKNCMKLIQTDIVANKDIYQMFINLKGDQNQ